MNARFLLTAAAAGIVCAQALTATPAAAQAKPAAPAAKPAGPWSKVPALPTACYSGQDQWSAQNSAAFDAVQQDHYRQNDINDEIRQNATDSFGADPMAVAARMQQKMMEDPANAQKIMEEMMAQNQKAQEEAPAQLAKEQQIETEAKTLMKQYEVALDKAMGPGNARLAALTKRYEPMEGAGSLWLRYGEPGEPDWVEPERHAILKQWDGAYAAACPQWWGAGGQFSAYLKRYRDFLVLERTPYEKQADQGRLQHYQTIGISTQGWRTTTDYEAAEDYMNMARSLFDQREAGPRCVAQIRCQ